MYNSLLLSGKEWMLNFATTMPTIACSNYKHLKPLLHLYYMYMCILYAVNNIGINNLYINRLIKQMLKSLLRYIMLKYFIYCNFHYWQPLSWWFWWYYIITLRACARGKVIGSVRPSVTTKIARSRHLSDPYVQSIRRRCRKTGFILLRIVWQDPRASQTLRFHWPCLSILPTMCFLLMHTTYHNT
jgi:hypothetical protein